MSNSSSRNTEGTSSKNDSKSSKRKRKVTSKQTNDDLEQITGTTGTSSTSGNTISNEDLPSEVIPSMEEEEIVTEATLEGAAKKKKKRTRKRQKSQRNDDGAETAVVETSAPNESVSTIVEEASSESIVTDGSDEIDRTVYMEGIPFHATYEQILDFLTRPNTTQQDTTSTKHDQTSTTTTGTGSTTKRTKIQRNEIIDVRLPIWQDTGRYRGYGHVVFTTQEIQHYAMQNLHQQYFFVIHNSADSHDKNHNHNNKNNRYISMTQAKSKRPPPATNSTLANDKDQANATSTPILSEPSKTIILRNLSYQATEEDIYHALEGLNTNTNAASSFTTPTLESGQIRIVRHTIPPYRSKGMAYVTFPNLNDAIHCMTCIQQQAASTLPFSICQRTITHYDYDHGRIKGSFRTAQHTFWSTTYRNSSNTNNNNNSTNINSSSNQQPQPRSLKHRMNK